MKQQGASWKELVLRRSQGIRDARTVAQGGDDRQVYGQPPCAQVVFLQHSSLRPREEKTSWDISKSLDSTPEPNWESDAALLGMVQWATVNRWREFSTSACAESTELPPTPNHWALGQEQQGQELRRT